MKKEIKVTPKASPTVEEVDSGKGLGVTLNSISIAGVITGGVGSVFLLFLGNGFLGVTLRFFQLWKFIDRLKLINVNSGFILSGFLGEIDSMTELDLASNDEQMKIANVSRGQLTSNGINLFILMAIPHKVAIYLANWILWIVYLIWSRKRSTEGSSS